MRYLSVCSGIEAATVAWHELGWTPVAFSEIEPFPSAVLVHHYPHVPNWGDLTRYADWPDTTADVLVGGTPCQSFSVAGFRAGLADPRGNLALTFLAAVDRYRPTWVVWENVPGVLSTNRGRDFGAFVGGLGQLGYGWAYRVLDAQYFGVAQRRRRVFVVGCLGSWQRAASVLFDAHSLSGHPAPRREAREDFANALTERPDRGGTNSEGQRLIPARHTAPTLPSRRSAGGGLGTDADCDGAVIAVASTGDVAHCLNAGAMGRIDYESETMIATAFDWQSGGDTRGARLQARPSLQACQTPAVLLQTNYVARAPIAWDEELNARHDLAGAILRGGDGGRHDGVAVPPAMAVRRLTPRECERLQGFPDDYTAIPWRKRPADECPDGPRYKALGNSMAVPVMRWIGQRLAYTHHVGSLVIPHGLAVEPGRSWEAHW